jgi:hypothetical protein
MTQDTKILDLEFKTPYDWCLEARLRPLDLRLWPELWHDSRERHFFEMLVSKKEMEGYLTKCGAVKPYSTPRKTIPYLEYRMYGIVPYNLSPIQQGIQYGHAVVEFLMSAFSNGGPLPIPLQKWGNTDKTFIILNGGTTNNNPKYSGSLNKHLAAIKATGIITAAFYEPDLGDQLTAFVFLVDERVFDQITYPDYEETPLIWKQRSKPPESVVAKWREDNDKNYAYWVEKIGGKQNEFLRKFLRPLKLA